MNMVESIVINEKLITTLSKDLKEASKNLTVNQARYLVDTYYKFQDQRIALGNTVGALEKSGEPNNVIAWLGSQSFTLEDRVKKILDIYTENHPIGNWARSNMGVGPVLAAGLISNVNIKEAPTAGHIWSYAGLDPNRRWIGKAEATKIVNDIVGTSKEVSFNHVIDIANIVNKDPIKLENSAKGDADKITKRGLIATISKRPWNSSLKVICWKLGESFVKVSGKDADIYGKLYKIRRKYEEDRNNAGENAEAAARYLSEKNYGKDTEAYKAYIEGKLPQSQIYARSKRYAVKIFLSHLHHAWYLYEFEQEPPKPFAIAHLGHAHFLEVPNLDIIYKAIKDKRD